MARHLKMQVPEHVYWSVVAQANDGGRAQSNIVAELLAEALTARALNTPVIATPAKHIDRDILVLAGMRGLSFENMRDYVLDLGWFTLLADLHEEAEGGAA